MIAAVGREVCGSRWSTGTLKLSMAGSSNPARYAVSWLASQVPARPARAPGCPRVDSNGRASAPQGQSGAGN
eukprot:10885700-Heterocapsa_arctica.AAC.1